MDAPWLGLLGILVIFLAVTEAMWTAALLDGGGPVTSALSAGLWRLGLRLAGRGRRQFLVITGSLILLLVILVWFLLLWLGWTLLFLADSQAVLHAADGKPADFTAVVYFAGFTITTLGVGDYVPGTALFQLLAPIAAGSGFFLISLFVAYLLTVFGSVLDQRRLATQIAFLGSSPTEVLRRAWSGSEYSRLEEQLITIARDLFGVGHRYHAYPGLRHFAAMHRHSAIGLQVAVLDEVLTLIGCGLRRDKDPLPPAVLQAREAIELFIKNVKAGTVAETPPLPPLSRLKSELPLRSEADYQSCTRAFADRRRQLVAMIRYQGWDWPAVGE